MGCLFSATCQNSVIEHLHKSETLLEGYDIVYCPKSSDSVFMEYCCKILSQMIIMMAEERRPLNFWNYNLLIFADVPFSLLIKNIIAICSFSDSGGENWLYSYTS